MRVQTLLFVTLLAMTPRIALAEDKPPAAAPTPAPKQEFVYLEFTGVEEAEVPAVMDALVRLDGVRTVAWTAPGKEAKVVREPGKAAHSLLVKAALDCGRRDRRRRPDHGRCVQVRQGPALPELREEGQPRGARGSWNQGVRGRRGPGPSHRGLRLPGREAAGRAGRTGQGRLRRDGGDPVGPRPWPRARRGALGRAAAARSSRPASPSRALPSSSGYPVLSAGSLRAPPASGHPMNPDARPAPDRPRRRRPRARRPHAGEPAPVVTVPTCANPICPIMHKPIVIKQFTETEMGRIYVCCPPCIAKIKKDVPAAYKLAYPTTTKAGNKTCPVTGKPLDDKAVTILLQGYEIGLSSADAIAAARADAQITLAKATRPKVVDVGNRTCPINGQPVVSERVRARRGRPGPPLVAGRRRGGPQGLREGAQGREGRRGRAGDADAEVARRRVGGRLPGTSARSGSNGARRGSHPRDEGGAGDHPRDERGAGDRSRNRRPPRLPPRASMRTSVDPLPRSDAMADVRIEKDSMGEVRVPAARLYGAQTQRAVDNFKVSGRPMPARFLTALAQVKWASAKANEDLGLLEPRLAKAIRDAADEVHRGQALRRVPDRRLPDGLGHLVEHEHERGALEPREPRARREARGEEAGPPERPREHGAVEQRRDPHDAPPVGGPGGEGAPAARARPPRERAPRQEPRRSTTW